MTDFASSPLLTPADVAARCQLSTKTVLRAIRSGRLRACRLGDRAYRIHPADVEAWLESSVVHAHAGSVSSDLQPGHRGAGRLAVPEVLPRR